MSSSGGTDGSGAGGPAPSNSKGVAAKNKIRPKPSTSKSTNRRRPTAASGAGGRCRGRSRSRSRRRRRTILIDQDGSEYEFEGDQQQEEEEEEEREDQGDGEEEEEEEEGEVPDDNDEGVVAKVEDVLIAQYPRCHLYARFEDGVDLNKPLVMYGNEPLAGDAFSLTHDYMEQFLPMNHGYNLDTQPDRMTVHFVAGNIDNDAFRVPDHYLARVYWMEFQDDQKESVYGHRLGVERCCLVTRNEEQARVLGQLKQKHNNIVYHSDCSDDEDDLDKSFHLGVEVAKFRKTDGGNVFSWMVGNDNFRQSYIAIFSAMLYSRLLDLTALRRKTINEIVVDPYPFYYAFEERLYFHQIVSAIAGFPHTQVCTADEFKPDGYDDAGKDEIVTYFTKSNTIAQGVETLLTKDKERFEKFIKNMRLPSCVCQLTGEQRRSVNAAFDKWIKRWLLSPCQLDEQPKALQEAMESEEPPIDQKRTSAVLRDQLIAIDQKTRRGLSFGTPGQITSRFLCNVARVWPHLVPTKYHRSMHETGRYDLWHQKHKPDVLNAPIEFDDPPADFDYCKVVSNQPVATAPQFALTPPMMMRSPPNQDDEEEEEEAEDHRFDPAEVIEAMSAMSTRDEEEEEEMDESDGEYVLPALPDNRPVPAETRRKEKEAEAEKQKRLKRQKEQQEEEEAAKKKKKAKELLDLERKKETKKPAPSSSSSGSSFPCSSFRQLSIDTSRPDSPPLEIISPIRDDFSPSWVAEMPTPDDEYLRIAPDAMKHPKDCRRGGCGCKRLRYLHPETTLHANKTLMEARWADREAKQPLAGANLFVLSVRLRHGVELAVFPSRSSERFHQWYPFPVTMSDKADYRIIPGELQQQQREAVMGFGREFVWRTDDKIWLMVMDPTIPWRYGLNHASSPYDAILLRNRAYIGCGMVIQIQVVDESEPRGPFVITRVSVRHELDDYIAVSEVCSHGLRHAGSFRLIWIAHVRLCFDYDTYDRRSEAMMSASGVTWLSGRYNNSNGPPALEDEQQSVYIDERHFREQGTEFNGVLKFTSSQADRKHFVYRFRTCITQYDVGEQQIEHSRDLPDYPGEVPPPMPLRRSLSGREMLDPMQIAIESVPANGTIVDVPLPRIPSPSPLPLPPPSPWQFAPVQTGASCAVIPKASPSSSFSGAPKPVEQKDVPKPKPTETKTMPPPAPRASAVKTKPPPSPSPKTSAVKTKPPPPPSPKTSAVKTKPPPAVTTAPAPVAVPPAPPVAVPATPVVTPPPVVAPAVAVNTVAVETKEREEKTMEIEQPVFVQQEQGQPLSPLLPTQRIEGVSSDEQQSSSSGDPSTFDFNLSPMPPDPQAGVPPNVPPVATRSESSNKRPASIVFEGSMVDLASSSSSSSCSSSSSSTATTAPASVCTTPEQSKQRRL